MNVHATDKFWNLGMVRMRGSFPAEKLIELVDSKLSEFTLCIQIDIGATVTDVASLMSKFGRLFGADHHKCYTHGLHLVVYDVLYGNRSNCSLGQNVTDNLFLEVVDEQMLTVDDATHNDSCDENDDDFDTAIEIISASDGLEGKEI